MIEIKEELVNKTPEDIKDHLYTSLMNTFDHVDIVKHQLSSIYEGVCNELDILEANRNAIKREQVKDLIVDIILSVLEDAGFVDELIQDRENLHNKTYDITEYVINNYRFREFCDLLKDKE